MEPVKVHEGTEAGRRLDITLELLSEFEGIPLTYKQLAALLGPGATDGAIKKWPVRGIPLKWARKIAPRGVERGLIGLTIDWLVDGVGIDPYRRGPAKVAKPTSSGRGFDMKGAAARIAKSLEAALRKSELWFLVGRMLDKGSTPEPVSIGAMTRKDVRFTLRLRRNQREKLDTAAAIESARRPSAVAAGSLLIELAMPAVEQIIASGAERRRKSA